MASVALVAFALGLDGGCFSVLLWLLSVAFVALGLLGSHWLVRLVLGKACWVQPTLCWAELSDLVLCLLDQWAGRMREPGPGRRTAQTAQSGTRQGLRRLRNVREGRPRGRTGQRGSRIREGRGEASDGCPAASHGRRRRRRDAEHPESAPPLQALKRDKRCTLESAALIVPSAVLPNTTFFCI